MYIGMALVAQSLAVGLSECQLHALGFCAPAFYWHYVMHASAGSDTAHGLAPLADRVLTDYLCAKLAPLSAVHQSLV